MLLLLAMLYSLCFNASFGQTDGENGPFECYYSKAAAKFHDEKLTFCREMDTKVSSDVRKPMQGQGEKTFYVDMTDHLDITWKDGKQKDISHLLYNASPCTLVMWDTMEPSPSNKSKCQHFAGFICTRKPESSTTQVNTSQIHRDAGHFESKELFTKSISPDTPISHEVGFSLDVISFLIGFFIPIPFLLVAVIKLVCSLKLTRAKVKKTASIRNIGSGGSSRAYGASTDEEFPAYATYVNVDHHVPLDDEGYVRSIGAQLQNGIRIFHEADSTYEIPIGRHSADEVHAAYETTEFQTHNFS